MPLPLNFYFLILSLKLKQKIFFFIPSLVGKGGAEGGGHMGTNNLIIEENNWNLDPIQH